MKINKFIAYITASFISALIFQPVIAKLATDPVLANEKPTVDAKLPSYQKSKIRLSNDESYAIISKGSDTLSGVMAAWVEKFNKSYYANVAFTVESGGSSTAPVGLIEGTAQLGPMSRKMKEEEIDSFNKKYGYKPTQIIVARDELAIFVNKDNPIKGLTMRQIDRIFSANINCIKDTKSINLNLKQPITTWGQLVGNWETEKSNNAPVYLANKPIELYGRNSVSGTYGYFKKVALCNGDFVGSNSNKNAANKKNNRVVTVQPGSAAVVQAVSDNINGIGYSGIGYKTASVRALPLAKNSKKFIEPGKLGYPLSRYLFIYINKQPWALPNKRVREFIKFVLSKEGQEIVIRSGYLPISSKIANATLEKLNKISGQQPNQ